MVSHQPPEHAVRDLPIWEVTVTALRYTIDNLSELARTAMFPLLLSTLLTVLSIQALSNPSTYLLLYLLTYVPHTLFAVAWHRRTLLNSEQIESSSIFAWQGHHWLFLFRTLLLLIILYGIIIFGSFPVVFIGSLIPVTLPLLIIGLLIGAGYVVARLSFVLPATAVKERYSLDNSWQQTKSQGSRLVRAYLLMIVPFALLYLILAPLVLNGLMSGEPQLPEMTDQLTFIDFIQPYLTHLQENAVGYAAGQIILLALTYFPIAAIITLLSFSFKICTGWVPAPVKDLEEENGNQNGNSDD